MQEISKHTPVASDAADLTRVLGSSERTPDDYVDILLHYFNSTTNDMFVKMNRGDVTRDEFIREVEKYLDKILPVKKGRDYKDEKEKIITKFKSWLWGFSVLESLIEDKEVSDIKVVSYNNVRQKKNGKRMPGNVQFQSEYEYERFVSSIAVRNSVNLSTLNAVQTFTDNDSHADWTLRITVATKFLTSTRQPILHIRKLPKEHRSLSYFEKKGLLVTMGQIEYFRERIRTTTGLLIVGKTGSGKTIFYNGLMDFIPHDKSIIVIQENEELNNKCRDKDFIPHPEMLFLHTVYASGEGKVEYDLKDLARMGLLFDIDYFGIGEVKGGEAKYLLNCIMTGSVGMCTAHGSSVEDGMDKVADYITYDTNYTKNEALAMLQRMNTVVFVEDFQIKDIAEIRGYDKESRKLIFHHIQFKD